ncbi:MAG: hypothetical protein R3E96_01740 [Planctomycetota bacterium]
MAIPRGNFPEIYRLRRQIEETQQSAPMLQIMVKYVQDRVAALESPYGPGSVRVKSRPVPTGFAWDLCVRESEPVLAIDFPAHSALWMDPDSAEASLRDGLGLSLKSGR